MSFQQAAQCVALHIYYIMTEELVLKVKQNNHTSIVKSHPKNHIV